MSDNNKQVKNYDLSYSMHIDAEQARLAQEVRLTNKKRRESQKDDIDDYPVNTYLTDKSEDNQKPIINTDLDRDLDAWTEHEKNINKEETYNIIKSDYNNSHILDDIYFDIKNTSSTISPLNSSINQLNKSKPSTISNIFSKIKNHISPSTAKKQEIASPISLSQIDKEKQEICEIPIAYPSTKNKQNIEKYRERTYSTDSFVDATLSTELTKINMASRKVSKWVEDDSVDQCYNCQNNFSFVLRKHHCRLCGRVFCYYCSNYFTKLPLDILNKIPNKPKSIGDVVWSEDLNNPVRVCGSCFTHANKLCRIRKIIKLFEYCKFDIRELNMLAKLSADWEDATKFILLKFREIQYKLSIDELLPSEKQLLWINRKYLAGHSRWMIQLAKSTDLTNNANIQMLESLMCCTKKNKCWDMLCTRFCSETIGITDILDLIIYNRNYPVITKFIIKCIYEIDTGLLKKYLPFLIHNLENNEFLLSILLEKGEQYFDFMVHVYWCIKIYCVNDTNRQTYIVKTLNFIKNNCSQDFRIKFKVMIESEKIDIKNLQELNKKPHIVLPICTDINFASVNDNNVKIMSSQSRPAIIEFIDNNGKPKSIMFKNDDIRKDHIVLNIIDIIHDILKKEETDLDIEIVQYDVMPTSKFTGYIEIVEGATTIFNIIEYSGISIQNYIMNHNKDLVIRDFKQKFINSTALYCVVSYLLGIGDRHLDNIMISKNGLLFHIDFGFILGQDPKYTNNRLIRVTPEIVNVIGGYGTEDYECFKKTCVRIYKRLRLHVNLFSNLLSIIPSIDPTITLDTIKKELSERFEIGENCIEAATHMDTKVESKNNFEYMIIDFLYKAKQSNIYKSVSYVTDSIFGLFGKS